MKSSRSFLIGLSVLLLLVTINQVVYATSETFPLSPATPIIRNVELEKNDRLVGSFTIKNLQTWKNAWGDTVSLIVSVTITDPKGQAIFSFTKTNGDSFDYTAFYSGVYKFRFSLGIGYYPPEGIEYPQATLNYNVINPSQSEPSTSGNLPDSMFPILIGGIVSVVIAIALVAYYAMSKRG